MSLYYQFYYDEAFAAFFKELINVRTTEIEGTEGKVYTLAELSIDWPSDLEFEELHKELMAGLYEKEGEGGMSKEQADIAIEKVKQTIERLRKE